MSRKRRVHNRQPAAPRVRELMDRGWCRRDADHLCVIELALAIAGDRSGLPGESLATLAGHVRTALAWEPVRAAVALHYLEPEHAYAWRGLARHTDVADLRDLLAGYGAAAEGREAVTVPLEDAFTLDDLRVAGEAQEAETRGDFATALALLGSVPRPLHDPWRDDLELALHAGDRLTPAKWGRLCCAMALRWAQGTTLGVDRGVAYARGVLLALGATGEIAEDNAHRQAAYDPLVHDALLFDEGTLSAYVATQLAPRVAARVPGLPAWGVALPRIVELVDRDGPDAVVHDLLSEDTLVIGDHPLADEHPVGRVFYGRLVQVDGDPRWWFAALPVVLEPVCVPDALAALAADVAPQERLLAIARRLSSRVLDEVDDLSLDDLEDLGGLDTPPPGEDDAGHDRPAA